MQQADWHQYTSEGGITVKVHQHKQTQTFDGPQGFIATHGYVLVDGLPANAQQVLECFAQSADLSECYARLSGQYWLVVCQEGKQPTILTDHLATKPCFYYFDNTTVWVSETLRAIKQIDGLNLAISKQALYNYLYFHCIPAPTTVYEGAFKMEPGKACTFASGGAKNEQLLYSPEFSNTLNDQQQALKTCLDKVEEAVGSHIGDKVGAFLSGGLDSSTVAGMLAKIQKNKTPSEAAKTFSIGFEVAGYDETEYALITANHFNTEHQVLYLKPEEAAKAFVEVAQYFDEPFGNSSAMAAYFCARFAKENGVELLLAGDGGDELFAGNERYAKQKVFEIYNRLPKWLGGLLNGMFNNGLMRKIPVLKKVASYLAQARVQLPGRLQTHNFVNQLGNEAIFSPELLANVDTEQPLQQLKARYDECKSQHPVDGMLYLDWKFTLADNDLVKVGKMCELAGLEVRYPLIDKHIVDFSCTVPADVKLPGSELRDFYKNACRGFLADQTLSKSKHGFGLPFGAWMKENQTLKDLTFTALNSFKQRNIVKESLIEQALEAHNSVHTGYFGELIWIMVVLELWLQKEAADFRA